MNCPNCNQQLGCGCQKRIANDGTKCCVYCLEKTNTQHESQRVISEARRFLANLNPR